MRETSEVIVIELKASYKKSGKKKINSRVPEKEIEKERKTKENERT